MVRAQTLIRLSKTSLLPADVILRVLPAALAFLTC